MDIPPFSPPDFPQGAAQPGLPPAETGHLPSDRPDLPQLSVDGLPTPEGGSQDEPEPDMTAPPERRPPAHPPEEVALRSGAAALGEDSRPVAASGITSETEGSNDAGSALGDVPPGDTTAEGGEAAPEARPFTVVEIGSGMTPSILAMDAPDTRRLLTEGGRYTAIDSNPERLAYGAQRIQNTMDSREELYGQPCGDVELSFHEGTVDIGAELPPNIEPGNADRVVLGNILSRHLPGTTRAGIVQTTADLLVPGGEAVVIDTLTPGVVPPDELDRTMASVGLEYVGSDDVEPYGASAETNPEAYVRRYRKPSAGPQDEPAPPAGTSAAEAGDLQQEAAEVPQGPITIVEIGAGSDPILLRPQAPDIKHLYRQGGEYIGLDADPLQLSHGKQATGLYRTVHTHPKATIDVRFEQANIAPGNPLAETVPADSAHRVVISNVFTHRPVADNPGVCDAIAETAMRIVDKVSGQVVVVGTLSPRVYPPARVDSLMARAGFERIGSDDPTLYHITPADADVSPHDYALRYRPRSQ